MKRILIAIIVLVILVVAGVYFYSKNKGTTTSYTSSVPSVTSATSSPEATSANAVSIINFSFNPSTLTVKAGTTVTWTNNDSVTHSIKSNTFNSPSNLAPGDTFNFTFTTPGTYNYNCGIHPSMTGTIVVQ